MKILTGKAVRQADLATIEREPISSFDLMERAAEEIARVICEKIEATRSLHFVIGKGNNGGDGLAAARMLSNAGFDCSVTFLCAQDVMSEDARINLDRLPETVRNIGLAQLDRLSPDTVIVDSVLGTGLTEAPRDTALDAVMAINRMSNQVISIDIPSGMPTEFGGDPHKIVRADLTITIGFPKLSMLLPETGKFCGDIEIVDIDLDQDFIESAYSPYRYTTEEFVGALVRRRNKFDNKGTYGRALLVCGSAQMPGAAVLAAGGALRSGCGLVAVHAPDAAIMPLMANYPSAVLSSESGPFFSNVPPDLEKYHAVGVGCGLGTEEATKNALSYLLSELTVPAVIDADALNIISGNPEIKMLIPKNSILTPHPKEFERLVGKWNGEEEKLNKLRQLASEIESVVVLKGAYTAVCRPDGMIYFNSTGNPGMAKGGSGDVLTGLATGLLARGYEPFEAAVIAVFVHGLAGDKTAEYYGMEAMNGQDLIEFIPEALNQIYR